MLDRFFAIEFDFLIDSIARCPHWPEKPWRFAPRVQYEGLRFSERRDFAQEMRIGFGGPAFSRQRQGNINAREAGDDLALLDHDRQD